MNYKEAWAFDVDGTLISNHKIMGFNSKKKFDYSDFIARSHNAPLVENVIAKVREANERGIPVVVITARCDNGRDATMALLERISEETGVIFDYVYTRPMSLLPAELTECENKTNIEIKEIIHRLHGLYKVDVVKDFERDFYPFVITEMFDDAMGILDQMDVLALRCNWIDEDGGIHYNVFGGKTYRGHYDYLS